MLGLFQAYPCKCAWKINNTRQRNLHLLQFTTLSDRGSVMALEGMALYSDGKKR